jgi:hypothetical protein
MRRLADTDVPALFSRSDVKYFKVKYVTRGNVAFEESKGA